MTSQEPTFIKTADGSLTLSFIEGSVSETMHSSAGAFGETLHVYFPVLEGVCNNPSWPPSFLSVGLGLGYVEMMVAGFSIQRNVAISLVSFETESWLVDHFISWLDGKEFKFYDEIAQTFEIFFKIPSGSIKKCLKKMRIEKHWVLRKTLKEGVLFQEKFSGIFFDAFSKLNEELWTSNFLNWFLEVAALENCIFATYASKRILKVCLKNARFKNMERHGWAHKRECTLALRSISRA